MTDFVTVETLTNYPGVVLSTTYATNTWVVEMVNDLINEVVESMDPVPTISDPPPAVVRNIAHRAAARALSNPDGYESLTIQIDDYKETSRFRDNSDVGVGVFLTPDEMSDIRGVLETPVEGAGPSGVGSIQLAVPGVCR